MSANVKAHRKTKKYGPITILPCVPSLGGEPWDYPIKRPFVLVNMAMTADGKIATANREVSSFGSPKDQTHLYELRATADAVMCGARTLEANSVHLGPGAPRFRKQRLKRGLDEYNLRVVVTGSGSIRPDAAIFSKHFSPIIVLTTASAGLTRIHRLQELADEVVICGQRELDFQVAVTHLYTRWGVRRLLCEGGGDLNDALFRAGLVKELHLTVCPYVFGGRTAPTIAGGKGFEHLAQVTKMRLKTLRHHKDEVFLVFRS